MYLKVLLLIAGLTLAPFAHAATLDFRFSFTDNQNGSGLVTGVIRGLAEGVSAASSVEVLSSQGGFGIGEYIGFPVTNSFTVQSGIIINYDFAAPGNRNASPDVTASTLIMTDGFGGGVGRVSTLSPSPCCARNSAGEVTFAPVPLPAGGALLLTGLAGFAALKRRKKVAA